MQSILCENSELSIFVASADLKTVRMMGARKEPQLERLASLHVSSEPPVHQAHSWPGQLCRC
jgi:hypothetical protein